MVAPLLHNNDPVNDSAVSVELPQLSDTKTPGADGIALGDATPLPASLVHPLIVCVTVYVPGVVTIIDAVVAPLLHNKLPVKPVAVKTELPQLSTTVTTGVDGIVLGEATPLPVAPAHPFII